MQDRTKRDQSGDPAEPQVRPFERPQGPLMGPDLGGSRRDSALDSARIISSEEQMKAFRRAKRHSRRVFILKWSLPVIALGIITGFVGWVSKHNPEETTEVVRFEDDKSLKQDELVMQNPNLNGYTDGRAYEVAADRATQKVETPNVINLETVKARITDEKQEWVTIGSKTGVFDQNNETLGLDGDVQVDSSLGYKLHTEKVAVDMPKGYMETLSPVNIASRDIRLSADRLEAIDNGEQFRFTGSVRLYVDAALLNKSPTKAQDQTEPLQQGAAQEEGDPQ
nr:LPS export ABC transporter periplasmic protein LptC [uncultured Cohaesibacter sp.]